MPFSAVAMQTQVFVINNKGFSGTTDPNDSRHEVYDWNNCRANLTLTPSGVTFITVNLNTSGGTIYLPYDDNHVCSMILPDPATAGGATSFLTASMSGCKFFVDTINGSSDLVVYHANAKQHSPGGHLSGTNPALELPAATTMLDGLHTSAQAYYRAAPHNFTLTQAASLAKPRYNRSAQMLVNSKTGIGHSHTEFLGGTLVAGFVSGGSWQFYFQTFGDVEYDRSFFKPKRWTDGKHKDGTTPSVLECGRFHP